MLEQHEGGCSALVMRRLSGSSPVLQHQNYFLKNFFLNNNATINIIIKPNIGKYISGANIISKIEGMLVLSSIILLIPAPKETPINNCGVKPISEPIK